MGDNDLSQRTLETIDDGAARLGVKDLGRRSKVTRARKKPPAPAIAPLDPGQVDDGAGKAVLMQSILTSHNTDLHARDAKGNAIPTLAERMRREGVKNNMPRIMARKAQAERAAQAKAAGEPAARPAARPAAKQRKGKK